MSFLVVLYAVMALLTFSVGVASAIVLLRRSSTPFDRMLAHGALAVIFWITAWHAGGVFGAIASAAALLEVLGVVRIGAKEKT